MEGGQYPPGLKERAKNSERCKNQGRNKNATHSGVRALSGSRRIAAASIQKGECLPWLSNPGQVGFPSILR
jgi:hypothetical protein